MVGAAVSCSMAVDPDVVSAAAALQVLPPTVQLSAPAGQDAGGATVAVAQVVELGALHDPLLHEYVAAPVVGAVVSCNTVVAPEVVNAVVALQV